MDDDSVSLKSEDGVGAFSSLSALISEHQPSIASLGYRLSPTEAPLLRLAVRIDMAVRATMPMPYFPEPFTAYKIRKPGQDHFLNSLSFSGKGENLESRRFIESGKTVLTDGAIFSGVGGIVTKTPARMETAYNQTIQKITLAILKRKQTLQALRSRCIQSHAFPKQWADILYAGLPFKCGRVTDATTPMMHILGVFDPISRMYAIMGRYSSKNFDQVIKTYEKPLTDVQKKVLSDANGELKTLGMTKNSRALVVLTAMRSGEAIYQILKQLNCELENNE
jgi:hypothetical protein